MTGTTIRDVVGRLSRHCRRICNFSGEGIRGASLRNWICSPTGYPGFHFRLRRRPRDRDAAGGKREGSPNGAAADAMPFLARAKKVEVLIAAGEPGKADEIAGADIAHHL